MGLICTGLTNKEIADRLGTTVSKLRHSKASTALLEKNSYDQRMRKRNKAVAMKPSVEVRKMSEVKDMIFKGKDLYAISAALHIPISLLEASKEVRAMFEVYQQTLKNVELKRFDLEEAKTLFLKGNTLEHIAAIFRVDVSALLAHLEFMDFVNSVKDSIPVVGDGIQRLDYEMVGKLAQLQCTLIEIAQVMRVSVSRLKADETAQMVIAQKKEAGKASLRRMQWAAAEKGNIPMLMFLGKQYLGQNDRGSAEESAQNVSFVLPIAVEKESEWEEMFKT